MLAQKRLLITAAGTLTAALSLTGCGSDNYGLSDAETAKLGAPPAAAPAVVGGLTDVEESADADAAEPDDAAADADADADADAESDAAEDDSPIRTAKPAGKVTNKLISKTVPKMGNVVTDAKGWVLYRFDKDKTSPSESSCLGDCAKLWPPMLADETLELSGLSAEKVSTIKRPDGGRQITINKWPVYRYIGDQEPGQWKGQNVGGTWFVIDKNGKKNLTCLPAISKPVALPNVKKATAKAKVSNNSDESADSGYSSSGGY